MPVALDELENCYAQEEGLHRYRLLSCTKTDIPRPITDKLDEMGIKHTCFYDVAPDPTLAVRERRRCSDDEHFEPDCIIALGGGSAMDAG